MKTVLEIRKQLSVGMSVQELRHKLSMLDDQDAIVMFSCNYGDYHNTQQVLPVLEIEERRMTDVHDSAYSQSGLAIVVDGGEEVRWYCGGCDEEGTHGRCQKCGEKCVSEDGETYDPDTDNDENGVVVLY